MGGPNWSQQEHHGRDDPPPLDAPSLTCGELHEGDDEDGQRNEAQEHHSNDDQLLLPRTRLQVVRTVVAQDLRRLRLLLVSHFIFSTGSGIQL